MTIADEQEPSAEITRLLEYLRGVRGFDFTGYKLSSLLRRICKRMAEVGVAGFAEYIDFLEVHPDEFGPLFNTVLINVTSFFRDPEAWRSVAEQVIPRILEKSADAPIRIWSAGCASGEEAYTIAMLLVEAAGEETFKRRVKIFATDADEGALAEARQATFDDRQVGALPPGMLGRYFEPLNGRHVFRSDLRRSLIFGRHDLVQDASISRLDLLCCRNTLMYFNSETQARILSRLHFSLAQDGYLFLGKAETLLTYGDSFRPVDLKRRIFQRAANTDSRGDRFSIAPPAAPREDSNGGRRIELREAAFDSGPIVQLMVDRLGRLRLANERARSLFGITMGDLDRPLRDLEISYRPIDLRSAIDAAYATRKTVRVGDFSWQDEPAGSAVVQLELQVSPIENGRQEVIGACLSFLDVTEAKALKAELDRTLRNLEAAYEELQSANEELETMNEELHSSNEELRMMNDQIVQRSSDVDQANDLLESTLESLHVGLAVLEADLSVATWSQGAEDLWGLRKDETLGQPFLRLDIGIPLISLRQPIFDCQAGISVGVVSIDGVNRRGKAIRCQVSCNLLPEANGTPGRIFLIMAESPRLTKLVE